jgi:hypothetical protein
MSIKSEVKTLKKEIDKIVNKSECNCGKTLFFYDNEYIYVKCRYCGEIKKFKR